jgi:ribosomal small subunit protein bTHX
MGRGDKRTRKGKIFSRSYGKTRLRRSVKKATKPAAAK